MNRPIFFLLVTAAFAAFAQAPAAQSSQAKTPSPKPKAATTSTDSPFKPAATVHELMHAMTEPGSKALWDIAIKAPSTDKDWEALQNAAVLVAESANLMMVPGVMRDRGTWMKSAALLARTGTASLKAARAKDLDKLTEAGNDMVESCDNCHLKYMKQ